MIARYGEPYRIPLPQQARVITNGDIPTNIEYDEVYYDHNTMSYKTASQERQNQILRLEIENKKQERKKSLKSIVGYFYKR